MSAAEDSTTASLGVVFMGTPDFAVPALSAILKAGHRVVAVYSQPPSRAGRGRSLRPSAVHAAAEQHRIPVFTPKSLKTPDAQARFAAHFTEQGAAIAVVTAYGLILPGPILQAPPLGCLNIHASLLPRWRGAAPIQRAIMAGDDRTGVTIMQMDEGLDTGPICLSAPLDIAPDMTAGRLHDRLSELGSTLICTALERALKGELICTPQPETGVTYAHKIDKSEARIDWTATASHISNHIRGLSPFPGAWCEVALDTAGNRRERIKLLLAEPCEGHGTPGEILTPDFDIACGRGAIRPLILQRAGKKPVPREAFLRGFPVMPTKMRLL